MVAMKADSERQRRNAPTFEWVNLPASGREGDPPVMPAGREWSEVTRAEWARIWATPQATMWDSTWPDWLNWCLLREQMLEKPSASAASEMRQFHHKLGLNPKAMLDLRWRIVEPSEAEKPEKVKGAQARKRYGHLQVAG